MTTNATQKEKLIALTAKRGMLRSRDALEAGLHSETLRRLCTEGALEKVGRGLYRLPGAEITSFHDLALAAAKAPRGVVCLLSALLYHEISTQLPREVWLAFGRTDRVPKIEHPVIRSVRFSGAAMAEGIDIHNIENIQVKITNPAKTIADCFKFRNKTGLEAALDALRDGLRDHKCTRDEIWHYAGINRVSNIIRPYLEATT